VDIGAERAGLLHVREMSAGYVRHPSELVRIGDEVEVRIVNYDRRKRCIDLSMMGIEPEAEEDQDDDEPMRTSMEIALQRAQAGQDDAGAPPGEPSQQGSRPDLSAREEILARTLEQHSRR
jgi:transcriptional accessory protein Tex/SPT6